MKQTWILAWARRCAAQDAAGPLKRVLRVNQQSLNLIFALHRRAHELTVCPQRLGGEGQSARVAPHSGENYLSVSPQLLVRVGEGSWMPPDGLQHYAAVSPQALRHQLKQPAVAPRIGERHVPVEACLLELRLARAPEVQSLALRDGLQALRLPRRPPHESDEGACAWKHALQELVVVQLAAFRHELLLEGGDARAPLHSMLELKHIP